jgi:ribonuclease P protein component
MPKFSKKERLCSKIIIQETLAKGKAIYNQPFKLIYLLKSEQDSVNIHTNSVPENNSLLQVAIVVPKRLFKKAVDRNALKRTIREAFRMNKGIILEALKPKNHKISLFLIYTDKNKADFQIVETKIKVLLHQLIKRINFESSNNNS